MKSLLTFALIAVVGLVYGWPPVHGSPSRRSTDPLTKIDHPVPPLLSDTEDAEEVTTCEYEGAVYALGEFSPDACKRCDCRRGGRVGCRSSACPPNPCVDAVQVAGHCCLQCPNGPNCMGPNGTVVPVGGKFKVPEHNLMCECEHMGHFTGASCVRQD